MLSSSIPSYKFPQREFSKCRTALSSSKKTWSPVPTCPRVLFSPMSLYLFTSCYTTAVGKDIIGRCNASRFECHFLVEVAWPTLKMNLNARSLRCPVNESDHRCLFPDIGCFQHIQFLVNLSTLNEAFCLPLQVQQSSTLKTTFANCVHANCVLIDNPADNQTLETLHNARLLPTKTTSRLEQRSFEQALFTEDVSA